MKKTLKKILVAVIIIVIMLAIQFIFGSDKFDVPIIIALILGFICNIVHTICKKTHISNKVAKISLIAEIVSILAIIILLIFSFKSALNSKSTKENNPNTASGNYVMLDDNAVPTYSTLESSKEMKIEISSGTHTITVSNKKFEVSGDGIRKKSKTEYEFDINNNERSFCITKYDNDSWVGKRLLGNDNSESTYITCFNHNDSSNAETETNNNNDENIAESNDYEDANFSHQEIHPSGKVYFSDAGPENSFEISFNTFSSREEAYEAIKEKKESFTIPENIAHNCTLRAEPTPDTARIWVTIELVGENYTPNGEIRLNDDNHWTENLDLSGFSGKQITIRLHYESKNAFYNKYEYVSAFLPE